MVTGYTVTGLVIKKRHTRKKENPIKPYRGRVILKPTTHIK